MTSERAVEPPMTEPEPPLIHVHSWQPVGVFPEDEVSHSPVSPMDHTVRTNQIAVTSCACGKLNRAVVSLGQWRWLNRTNR